jgi:hypothetical protein
MLQKNSFDIILPRQILTTSDTIHLLRRSKTFVPCRDLGTMKRSLNIQKNCVEVVTQVLEI